MKLDSNGIFVKRQTFEVFPQFVALQAMFLVIGIYKTYLIMQIT